MLSTETLSQFLGKPYDFNHSPQLGLEAESVNCQRLIHQIYQSRLGVQLPLGMWSQEIFHDDLIFETVDHFVFEADIGIFGPAYVTDPRYFHLAYFTGRDDGGDPLFIHATVYDRQVSVWKLSDLFKKPRYEELKRIKRVKPQLFDTQVRPVIINS